MRLTSTNVDVVTRTPPLGEGPAGVSRLSADGVHGGFCLQARVVVASAASGATVRRYAYRLAGGAVRHANTVNVRLVSDGAVAYVFDRDGVVNDGRWYIHDHETDVDAGALVYARFEAWFDVPGVARLAWAGLREPARSLGRPLDRVARGRVGARAGHARDVDRPADRA